MNRTKLRLLLDEMYPSELGEQLRQRGVDAIAVKERDDWSGLTDEELLAVARAHQRVIVTENVDDFSTLARTADHMGIVFCHSQRFPRDAKHLGRLIAALEALAASPPTGLGDHPIQWWLR